MSAPESSKMGDKNESDGSYSGDNSSTTSDSSSGSSEGEEELMEPVSVLGHTFELPQVLCEDYGVFKEFFSMKTWDSLSDEHKDHLKQYLPKFSQDDDEETEKTVKMLFNFEPFHFTSPLGDFFNNLRQGNYRPDIAKMRKFLKKARAKQQRHRKRSYYAKLLPEVLISRERLLAVAKGCPPGPVPPLTCLPRKPSNKDIYNSIFARTKLRYFEELAAIRNEVGGDDSEDDNYPDGPPQQYIRKKKQASAGHSSESSVSGTLGGRDSSSPTSLECLKNVLAAHRMRRQYRDDHPELDTSGLTLEDIKQRVALVNGAKKLMFGGQKGDTSVQKLKRGPKKESGGKQSRPPEGKGGKKKEEPQFVQETAENRPLLPNIKIKCEQEESDSESSSFVDPVTSPKPSKNPEQVEIKQEVIDPRYNVPNINYNEPNLEDVIKQEPLDHSLSMQTTARVIQPVPIKLEDLDGIDMMALPVEIADDSGEVVQVNTSAETTEEPVLDPDEALTETTHANFLSLVRALFPARAAHRASKQQLHARLAAVMRSPIAPLNTWYSLSDDWCVELDSALSFLAGERGPHPDDFVPYLQFMPESQMYQWIGAGRDCDSLLGRLCERWMNAASPPPPTEPPPPKYPTSFVLRSPSSAELIDFRAQERKRFSSAAKPFTYVHYGYRSVVGPCARASMSCAGHTLLLVPDRPRHANFLALVRDAVARLPNGEGTRHDVVTLLKMSQWIAPCTDLALLSAVSSALDRLHSAKRDPMVKFDQRTATWTYLHRHRSEEDWAKSSSGRSRKSSSTAALPPPSAAAAPPPAAARAPAAGEYAPPHAMEMEVASIEEVGDNESDTDVDVDDSGSPPAPPRLSSAQLLIQATSSQPKPSPANPQTKPKGKLVAVSPPKPKPQPKPTPPPKQPTPTPVIKPTNPPKSQKTLPTKLPTKPPQPKPSVNLVSPKQNLMAQAVKQATLMAQSAKQASVIAQLTKQVQKGGSVIQSKQVNVVKPPAQPPKTAKQPVQVKPPQIPKPSTPQPPPKQEPPKVTPAAMPAPPTVPAPHKSPLIKQRPLQKPPEVSTSISTASILTPQVVQASSVMSSATTTPTAATSKVVQGTRSLLIRAPSVQTTVTAAVTTSTTQVPAAQRRGIVRVLSPVTPSGGKSLISPRALMQQTTATTKKRVTPQESPSVTAVAQSATMAATTVVSSVGSVVSVGTRLQLGGARGACGARGGRGGHALQLSAHSVRLPSGQTVQLAAPHGLRALPLSAGARPASPRPQAPASSPKAAQSALQIPISSVQIAGQTVQIAGQTVQLASQSVQLTGHTVKLPSGQSVQVASQSVLQPQSVQLPSGQTVQLTSGSVQTVQLGQNVLTNQGSNTVQLSGQTVQLAGQTVQLPSGQTLQLAGGQTVQLPSGQTIQLASGQTVQLANQQAKTVAQVARSQTGEKIAQPIVAKLLTNAQGPMISLEGGSGARTLQVSGVRVLSPARMPRPLLLTATKPLHNMILQQGDGSTIRGTSAGGVSTSQTIVISNIGAQAGTTSTTTAPVLKLQQAGTSTAGAAGTTAVRSVVMDAQQLKLVGGRHVLARILRPTQPPPQPPQ